jgi:hypothetical protein
MTTTDETGKPRATVVWFDPSRRPGLRPRPLTGQDGITDERAARVARTFIRLAPEDQAVVEEFINALA